jgi:hypothetical protein
LAVIATVQVTVLLLVQPVHEEKLLPPEVAGAVSVTDVPELYVSVKLVVPVVLPPLSAGEAPIATPLTGLVEFTVKV